ncbi:MAG: GlsB/YeaQ/YmgE family stress response membrane protein [Tsuneonella sp.]
MGLVILIVAGGVMGWLASIVVRANDRQGILLNVAIGIVGALVAGLASNDGPVVAGLSATALIGGFVGALLMLALANLLRTQQTG